jgi:hypothetical protein
VAALADAAAVMVACGVELVVVGGVAVWLHGDRSDPLKDLDVVPAPTSANLERLVCSRAALGAYARTWPSTRRLHQSELETVQTSFGPIDLLTQRGREEYGSLRAAATVVSVRETPVAVASVADVIRLKRQFKEFADV